MVVLPVQYDSNAANSDGSATSSMHKFCQFDAEMLSVLCRDVFSSMQ